MEQGAHYVLTAKLNQDPLEALLLLFNSGMHTNFVPIVGSFFFQRHFGLAQSFGGDESHPTVINFTHIFCLLSLYTLAKTVLRGGVEGAAISVFIGVKDTLKETRNVHQSHKIATQEPVQTKLQGVTLNSDTALELACCDTDDPKALPFQLCNSQDWKVHTMLPVHSRYQL